jgi:glycosyltransferase involved in cell wall biosynthesis
VEAHKWELALRAMGWEVTTVAGEGGDVDVAGLAYDTTRISPRDERGPDPVELSEALAGFDVVIAENILSLPVHRAASDAVAGALRGHRVVVKHHDLPWHRPASRDWPLPDDPGWIHVTTTAWAAAELAQRTGLRPTVMRNRFAVDEPPGDRDGTRAERDVDGLVLLQPTRALPRKNIPAGLALAQDVGAAFWLLGPAEDGYQAELDRVLATATARVLRGDGGRPVRDAYAASDGVVLPSTWEGFGNPAIESALARRPLAIGEHPASRELRQFGFRWFALDESAAMARAMSEPSAELVEHNRAVAATHFDLADLPDEIESLLASAVW